jgi:two-component system chemotaxis response regulator CheY
MHALVIDDSRAMRIILGGMLKELGFDVSEAAHGRDGLERLKQAPAPTNLALVDWNMPEMNGLDFVKAVRADHAYDDVRLVVVSTETEMTQVGRALDAGANDYVMKPFTKAVILDKIKLLGLA